MFFVIAYAFFAAMRVILIMLNVFLITMSNELSLINIFVFLFNLLGSNSIDLCLLIFIMRHIFYLSLLH